MGDRALNSQDVLHLWGASSLGGRGAPAPPSPNPSLIGQTEPTNLELLCEGSWQSVRVCLAGRRISAVRKPFEHGPVATVLAMVGGWGHRSVDRSIASDGAVRELAF